MELLRRVWQWLTAPRFAVKISATDYDENIYVTAGKKTKFCTVSVSLDYNGQLDRSEYFRPCSDYYQDRNVYVTCGNERWNNGTLDLDLFVYVTVAGFYSIIPEFPEEISYVKFINVIPMFPLQVKPSNTCSIVLKNYENSNPIEDELGTKFISYRGDTVKIYVDVVEEFENKYDEDDLDFRIVSDNQALKLVQPPTHDRCTGWYLISARFQKVGTTTIELTLQEDVHLNAHALRQKVKVITPPVSAVNSFIIQSDIDKIQERIHEAGQAIAFKLKLNDIFRNAICYEESKPLVESIRIAFQDTSQVSVVDQDALEKSSQSTKEENSFKTNPSDVDSNACELTFTPYTAGKRLLSLFLREKDKEVKKPPLSFAVEPGPLADVQIVRHEPPATDQNILFSYSKQSRIVVVKGKDEFGNEVAMDPNKWYLDTLGGLQQEANRTGENVLKFKYNFDKPGLYKVDIKPKECTTKSTKVPFFDVEIIKAPLDLNKCLCECANEKPIFAGEPQSSLRIRVNLFDCINNRYSLQANSEFKTELLSIKVNGQACEVESCTKEGEIYMTTVFESEHVVIKDVQVTYNDKPLGQTLLPVHLQPYTTDDFVRLYRNKKKICCKDVCRGMLADYANLENINRIVLKSQNVVLESSDIKENTENKKVQLIDVDLEKFKHKILTEFKEIISLWVEGTHYRNQANEFDTEREKWKTKSMDAYSSKKHEEAKACSDIKEKFATLMNQSHRRASDAIFTFYNRSRPQSEIDLHGQLVADTEKMVEYKKQLLKKGNTKAADVDSIIEKERQERDEAIGKLEKRLVNFDHEKAKQDGEDWLEIIDGAGHHSARRGEQKIRPKVEEYLKKKKIKYVKANKGALLITFSEYTGGQPCVADFYCTKCKKPWTSKSSWKGLYQKCFRCDSRGITDSKCYPFKLRPRTPEKRREKSSSSFRREDHRRLCEKCIQLGRDCRPQ